MEIDTQPQAGDRILVLKQEWLDLILSGDKTLELRCQPLKPGLAFLGHKGVIHGIATLGDAVAIPDLSSYGALAEKHMCLADKLPYKKTWGLPLLAVRRLTSTVPYVHRRGAIGIVTYRGSPELVRRYVETEQRRPSKRAKTSPQS
jgi:hypothetical protein